MIVIEFVGQGLKICIGQVAFVQGGKPPHCREQVPQQRRWKIYSHSLQFVAKQPSTGLAAHNHFSGRVPNVLGCERLIGGTIFQ